MHREYGGLDFPPANYTDGIDDKKQYRDDVQGDE